MTVKLTNFTPLIDEVCQDVGFVGALVYGVVFRYCQMERGRCDAAAETIAERANCSAKTVRRHLAALVEHGYLVDTTPEVRHKPHIYRLTDKAGMTLHVTGEGEDEAGGGLDSKSNPAQPSLDSKSNPDPPGWSESPSEVGQKVQARLDSKSTKETLLRDSSKRPGESAAPGAGAPPPAPPEPPDPSPSEPDSGPHPPNSAAPPAPATLTVAGAWEWALACRDDRAALAQMLAQERAGRNRVTLIDSLAKLIEAAPGAAVALRGPAQREQDAMVAALAEVAFLAGEPEAFEALSAGAQANLRRAAAQFRKHDRTPDQVRRFGQWWYQVRWTGMPGVTPPTLKQIKDQWFGAMRWAGQPQQGEDHARQQPHPAAPGGNPGTGHGSYFTLDAADWDPAPGPGV